MKKCDMMLGEIRDFLRRYPDSNVICFGTGMVAQHVKHIFEKYGLWERVCCFVDNDPDKQGEVVSVGDMVFPIVAPAELYQKKYSSDIVIILSEYTEQIEKQLTEQLGFTPQLYIDYPYVNEQMIRESIESEKNNFYKIIKKEAKDKIPPILHCCWFGSKEMPKDQAAYLQTWKEICPNYIVMVWNESNYDLNACRYVREAYETKNYAFVSDYVRMDVVYHYGGIYLDTDVELKQNLDWLRKYKAFFAYGKWPAVNSGCGFGAEPHSELIREIRDCPRKNISFVMENGRLNKTTNCYYESVILEKHGFRMDFLTQIVEDVLLLSPLFFPSITHMNILESESSFIMAQHHDAGSWRK